jgi:hypothetical protein
MAFWQHTILNQKLFILAVMLIILGLFLPWYAVGDLVSINIHPLIFNWTTTFTEAGGRLYLPSIEQNMPYGLLSLLGAATLIVLRFGKLSKQIVKWAAFGVALFLLFTSIYHLISIWNLYMAGGRIGLTPPGFGLYIFLLGSFILILISLRTLISRNS